MIGFIKGDTRSLDHGSYLHARVTQRLGRTWRVDARTSTYPRIPLNPHDVWFSAVSVCILGSKHLSARILPLVG